MILAEAGGRLVPHETLRAKLWPNVVVEDRTLTVHMSTLRKALGNGSPAEIIETVPRAGYRLALPVRLPVASRRRPAPMAEATTARRADLLDGRPGRRPTAISGSASPTR